MIITEITNALYKYFNEDVSEHLLSNGMFCYFKNGSRAYTLSFVYGGEEVRAILSNGVMLTFWIEGEKPYSMETCKNALERAFKSFGFNIESVNAPQN